MVTFKLSLVEKILNFSEREKKCGGVREGVFQVEATASAKARGCVNSD